MFVVCVCTFCHLPGGHTYAKNGHEKSHIQPPEGRWLCVYYTLMGMSAGLLFTQRPINEPTALPIIVFPIATTAKRK
jgi:hypothetical protein